MPHSTITHLRLHRDDSGGDKKTRLLSGMAAAKFLAQAPAAPAKVRAPVTRQPAASEPARKAARASVGPALAALEKPLSARLEGLLRAGTQTLGCAAAALYMLNDETSELVLRSAWQLEKTPLGTARPLRGAAADLEALTGHALAIEDTSLLPHWRVPESFPSALCVPVSTADLPLGTLWAFARTPGDFGPLQAAFWEAVGGRIAGELERADLARELAAAAPLQREFAAALAWQAQRSLPVAPEIPGWEIAADGHGKTARGGFRHWQVLANGGLAAAVGRSHARGLSATLADACALAALQAHCEYQSTASALAQRVSETLWRRSPGDDSLSLACAVAEPARGAVAYSLAGRAHGFALKENGEEILVGQSDALAAESEIRLREYSLTLRRGECAVLFELPARGATLAASACPVNTTRVARALRPLVQAPLAELAQGVRRQLGLATGEGDPAANLLVLRRQ